MRCYEVDITFHYQIDGGLTNSTTTNTKVQFSSLFQQVLSHLSHQPGCSDVMVTRKDILSSPPGVKSIFFTIPMIFTASTNVVDGQISTKIVACISTLTASYKGFIDSNTPSISQNGTHTTYNTSTISEKRSCCGGNIPPPCCTVGSVNVSSSKCGKFKQRMDFICSWPMESWPVENIDPSLSWVLSPFCRLFARVPFCSWQFMSALSFRHLSGRTRSKFMQEVSRKKTNIWKNSNDQQFQLPRWALNIRERVGKIGFLGKRRAHLSSDIPSSISSVFFISLD